MRVWSHSLQPTLAQERGTAHDRLCVRRLGINGEIIVVNDGSSDNTGSLAEGLAKVHPFVRVLHHESPQGIGASFWDGVQNTRGDVVTMIPGGYKPEEGQSASAPGCLSSPARFPRG